MAENTPKTTVKGKYLEYKGKPLVREGNTICYGDMTEKYVLLLEIMSYKKAGVFIGHLFFYHIHVKRKSNTSF